MSNRFSLYKIHKKENIPFSAQEYSRFKYGDASIALRFGKELADSFLSQYRDIALLPKLNLFSSPFQFIPTATYPLALSFLHSLNAFRSYNNLPACKFSRILRHTTYTQDYGQMSAVMRMQLIGADLFDFEGIRSEDEFLLMVDDILITGSHELVVRKALKSGGYTNNNMYLYFAELVNPDIDPSIENELNYAFVKTLPDFETILHSEHFQFNTRNIKFILGLNSDQSSRLISDLTEIKLNKLSSLALGDDYLSKPQFRDNLSKII
jgi:hypothetical protein